MTKTVVLTGAAALAVGLGAGAMLAQQAPRAPYVVGNALGLPVEPPPTATFAPTSSNVKVYGAIYSAESCSYDPARNLIVVPNRGVPQNVQTNNAWVSLLNHDGSVHTARWIGVQNAGARAPTSRRRSSSTSPTAATSSTARCTSPTATAARAPTTRAWP